MQDNNNLPDVPSPQITEQLATDDTPQISPVDYVYESIKTKAEQPSLLEQKDAIADDAAYFSDMFSNDDGKVSFNEDRINVNEAYTKLSDGSYITRYDEGFVKGADNEQRYAESQTTGEKWLNGLTKFGVKTANNVVGGVAGTAVGAISAIANGNWENIYDNEFYDFLDDQNTKMDNFVANYRTQEERDMGFFESATTANFWADDFLGGLSFMTGTVISESIWAAATGGSSLTTTAARVGLRASKYFNTAVKLTKGVKEAQKVARQFNRLSSINKATRLAKTGGKIGQTANLLRFTYTGAGFEAGMEARLYEKEQRDSFYRDFESLNDRKPFPEEVSNFEDNLGKTSNALWATNMALVGTSNFAVLGKTFGVTSPFKLQSKSLNKVLFGIGTETKTGKLGERVASNAIKRNKLQKTLGFSKGVLKNPFYEGFVEEGGQAASSNAMEGYLTSRYNPSEDALGVSESMYEGLSHTFGTKEGWKEVGLGALIGLVGGEGSTALSGGGLFTEAREALKDSDKNSVLEAESLNDNLGTKVADRIFASKFEENLAQATEIQNAQSEYDAAESDGSVMGMANAQGKIILTSVKNAVDFDYLEDQIEDFRAGLDMQDPADIAAHYSIDISEVDAKKDEMLNEFTKIGDSYKAAKEFADYIISDNPKEKMPDGSDIDVRVAKTAIAYQMVVTEIMEKNMDGAHEALMSSIQELNPQMLGKYAKALKRFAQINKSTKKSVQELNKSQVKLKNKQNQLEVLNKRLLKADQVKAKADTEGNQGNADRYNKIANKIFEVQEAVIALKTEVADKEGKLAQASTESDNYSAATQALANQLDAADPLAGQDLVEQETLEDTQNLLAELDVALTEASKSNPRMVQKISKLGQEYRSGLEMWQRNAETLQDIADPEMGLKRVGTMMQRKKTAGETTLNFLKRVQQTQLEEKAFSDKIQDLVDKKANEGQESTEEVVSEEKEQTKAEENPGENVTEDSSDIVTGDPVTDKVAELKKALKELIGKNNFVLENFSNDAESIENEKAPTQEEVDEYTSLRNKFKSGDINKLIGKPVNEIGARTKERSGLSDKEISRYQELSQSMLDWRIVTGTNADGISIQDILDQIDAYQKDLQEVGEQVTTEQALEMAEQGQSEFSGDARNPDYVNSMDKVNIKQDSIQTTFSHLDIDTVIESDFATSYEGKVNRGTEDKPDMATKYTLTRNGESFDVFYTDNHHNLIVGNKNKDAFLEGMNMQTVKYNTKTGWGYVFRDGVPMDSDFGINLISNPEVNILNPQLIYELEPGDKLSFVLNMKDVYNNEKILPLMQQGRFPEARALMSVYVVNKDGAVVGFLKSGVDTEGSNFNKVREEADAALSEHMTEMEVSLEDLANDNTNSVVNIPFETEVEKTFVGTPNIELNPDRSVKAFPIAEKNFNQIIGFGYSKDGKMSLSEGSELKEIDGVRKTFIPKGKNTPFVIIKRGNTNIAFPVGMKATDSTLQNQVMETLQSETREQDKVKSIILLLKENGVEPAQFNLDSLKDNTAELDRLLKSLDNAERSYSPKELSAMSKEDFLGASEIIINLDKPAFVSPKVKMALSKKLTDTRTKKTTASKKLTAKERRDLIAQHLDQIVVASTEEDVSKVVAETGDEVFKAEFLENAKFRKDVIKAAMASKPIPSINTDYTIQNLIQDLVDSNYNDIPLDLQEQFEAEVADLKAEFTEQKLKSLADKVKNSLDDKYVIVSAAMDTTNTYHIPTSQSEDAMFEDGYVRVSEDFYKKVNKSLSLEEVTAGLYERYKNNTLPAHMGLKRGMTFEQFEDFMPNTLLDTYKKYYNTQTTLPYALKATVVGNEQYLKEDFKGDFAKFKQDQKNLGSELYKKVLSKLTPTEGGIIKSDELTRDMIDEFQSEMGPIYPALINYSLINKHINLQEQPKNIIFVQDVEDTKRLKAVNNPNLKEVKEQAEIIDDKTISFSKVNEEFIKHKGFVYEQVESNGQGVYTYESIAEIDPNFIVTNVVAPFSTNSEPKTKEIDTTGTNINETDGSEINC